MDLSTSALAEEQSRWLGKEIRGVRKKLSQIAKLRDSEANSFILTTDERAKMDRKPVLEAELHVYQTALDEVERRIEELALESTDKYPKHKTALIENCMEPKESSGQGERSKAELCMDETELGNTTRFSCVVCGVKCPDSKSFELHNSGRKHRNRLAQVAEAEKKQAAQSIMAQKQLDEVKLESISSVLPSKHARKNVWGVSANPQPRYTLPPPPHPVVPQVAAPTHAVKLLSQSKTLKTAPPLPHATHLQSTPHDKKANMVKTTKHQPPIRQIDASLPSAWNVPASTPPSTKKALPFHLHAAPNLTKPFTPNADQRNAYSLADFLVPKPQPKPKTLSLASWASPQKVAAPAPSPKAKCLAEIQAEEADFKAREDRACEGDKVWFMGRRERAGSLHAIQEAAEQERELQLMIQEQMEIEAQIQRDLVAQRRKEKGQAKGKKGMKKGAADKSRTVNLQLPKDQIHAINPADKIEDIDRKPAVNDRGARTHPRNLRLNEIKAPAALEGVRGPTVVNATPSLEA